MGGVCIWRRPDDIPLDDILEDADNTAVADFITGCQIRAARLKPIANVHIVATSGLNECPDEERITTARPKRVRHCKLSLNECPDEEGITTFVARSPKAPLACWCASSFDALYRLEWIDEKDLAARQRIVVGLYLGP